TAVEVMVLAMHVAGNGTADADEARAGRDRQEPAARQEDIDQLGQSDPGVAVDRALVRIERMQAVERAGRENVGGQGAVAIAAPHAPGDYRAAVRKVPSGRGRSGQLLQLR